MSGSFVMPTHCFRCGACLMGGATRHERDCPIRKDIEEFFPGFKLPDPEDVESGDEATEP